MLHTQTVSPILLGVLRELMTVSALSNFSLVWGTNLSLRYGHRLSVDIDLFTQDWLDADTIRRILNESFGDRVLPTSYNEHMFFCQIDGVKCDFVNYPYPLVSPLEIIDDIRMMSAPDVCAFKLNAVARRWAKKDFRDLAQLLHYYSLDEMIAWFYQKFGQMDRFHLLRSLTYFWDADAERNDPISLTGQTRPEVKQAIVTVWEEYMRREL